MRKRCTETKQQLLFSISFNALKWQADTTNGMGTLSYKLVLHSDLGPHPCDTEDSKDPPQVRIFPAPGHQSRTNRQKGWTQSRGSTQHPAKPLLAPNFLLRDSKLHEEQNHCKLRLIFTESGTFLKLYKP